MSETEPIPPTSSVTALRIPIIKKVKSAEPVISQRIYSSYLEQGCQTAANCVSHSDEIIVLLDQQASMPKLNDVEDLAAKLMKLL
ncbi:hypothetical protein Tco_0790464 [Tanacetum coccineum]